MLTLQGVALTGRNNTGPPWSVGRSASGSPAGSVTDASEQKQNSTDPLGGPVIISDHVSRERKE